MSVALPLSNRAKRTTDSPISYFIQTAVETPGLISLAAGLVDESAFPSMEIAAIVAELLADPNTAKAALQYGSTLGYAPLRQKVLDHVCESDGIRPGDANLAVADVVLTTGSQQMLYLLCELLVDPGDIVIAEAPSYFVFHDCLKSSGADVRTVPMDGGGMCLDSLEKLLESLDRSGELERLKMIYTVDYFQNPTGISLAADRRPKLVELARRFSRKHRILILEDAAYRELRYDGADLPSIKRFDTTNEHVVYASTFSKPCAPGLKTGYSIVPRDLVRPIGNLKGSHDFGSSNLSQHILDRLLGNRAYQRHVEVLRGVYRRKRDAMVGALADEFADWPEVSWTVADGGFYSWLAFPNRIATGRDGELVRRSVAEGVLFIPGELAHVPDIHGIRPANEIRLCFGVEEPPRIIEGIRRLRRACRGLEI
jgi:2-aminoadipate transaminase